jgi:hypothetical protein
MPPLPPRDNSEAFGLSLTSAASFDGGGKSL